MGLAPYYLSVTMTETIQVRQTNPEEEEKMAKLDSEEDVYGYLSRKLGNKLGEFIEIELAPESGKEVPADGVTGKGSGNYVTFESPGGNIVGFGVHLSILEDVLDFEVERDEDDNVLNAPESVGITLRPSDEDSYEEAQEADEEEAEALIDGETDDSEDEEEEETVDADEEAEAMVEVSDEEIGLADE